MNLFPLVSLSQVTLAEANDLLVRFGHRIGEINRPNGAVYSYALFHMDRAVAVSVTAGLVRESVGGVSGLSRGNAIELARLCAVRPDLCRVMLRLWREFVFPVFEKPFAVSYQDAALHGGDLYRFDGWVRAGYSRSGTDSRSGRKGRNKWVWVWSGDATERARLKAAAAPIGAAA